MAGVKQYETDIAIVGAGGAGIAAGIEARDAGAHAIVFEKSSEAGGAAIISGGGCLIVGSPLQQQNGIHDTPTWPSRTGSNGEVRRPTRSGPATTSSTRSTISITGPNASA